MLAGSVRNSVDIVATGSEDKTSLTVEIRSHRNEFTQDQCQQIEELCLEEELVRVLESVQEQDISLVIALILSRQLGWPIDFYNDATNCTFTIIVPTKPYEKFAPILLNDSVENE